MVIFTNYPLSAEKKVLLSFLLFYGLVVGKYALIRVKIQKIQMVVHVFSGFTSFTELMRVYRGVNPSAGS